MASSASETRRQLSSLGKDLLHHGLGCAEKPTKIPVKDNKGVKREDISKQPLARRDPICAEIHRLRQLSHFQTSLGGVWSPAQEKQLVEAVSELSESWEDVSSRVHGHSAMECCERWTELTREASVLHKTRSKLRGAKHATPHLAKPSSSGFLSYSSSSFVKMRVEGQIIMIINKVINCSPPKQFRRSKHIRCYVRMEMEGYRYNTKVERRSGLTEDGQVVDLKHIIKLPDSVQPDTMLRFKVMIKHRLIQDEVVGVAHISAGTLFERRSRRLVLVDDDDYLVMHKARPIMLETKLIQTSLPESWPQPLPSQDSMRHALTEQYPRHVLIITRGTRGDVQPFIALARGLAEQLGWKITICTELCYRDYIKKHGQVSRGTIRFRPCGGNTPKRVDSDTTRWAVSFESTNMQTIMLAWAEREFFESEPAMFYWAEKLQPDLLLFGFTVTNIAMIISEALNIPLIGFILQPTCMPSEQYPPVFPLKQEKFEKWRDDARGKSAHDTVTQVKGAVEKTKLFAMRDRHGLQSTSQPRLWSRTWEQIASNNIPIVVPISHYAFGGRPKDWHSNALLTTYIFLKGKTVPTLKPSLEDFLQSAKIKEFKVVVLAFSSMPVEQSTIFDITLRILTKCKAKVNVIALIGDHSNDAPLKEDVQQQVRTLVRQQRLFIDKGAPFGKLFPRVDAIVAHGGLGTTADAIVAKVPVIVTGVMLMDQRFWGSRCFEMGIGKCQDLNAKGEVSGVISEVWLGPYPLHIQRFPSKCVGIIDRALKDGSEWQKNAKEHGAKLEASMMEDPSGVATNVKAIEILEKYANPYVYVEQDSGRK